MNKRQQVKELKKEIAVWKDKYRTLKTRAYETLYGVRTKVMPVAPRNWSPTTINYAAVEHKVAAMIARNRHEDHE